MFKNPALILAKLQAVLFRSGFAFFVFFAFVPPFAFFGDLPKNVSPDPKSEGFFPTLGQWLSAGFHTLLSLILMVTLGPWGFISLALTVTIVARRLSASKGVAYNLTDLRDDLREQLAGSVRTMRVVVWGTAAALSLHLATVFGALTVLPAAVVSAAVWGAWMRLAWKASATNAAAVLKERADWTKYAPMLSKAFTAPLGDWEFARIVDGGLQLIVTPPPMSAVLHYSTAGNVLATLAPEWEFSEESDHTSLILNAATEETVRRRLELARSGGLIAGRIDGLSTNAPAPALAGFAITADDLI